MTQDPSRPASPLGRLSVVCALCAAVGPVDPRAQEPTPPSTEVEALAPRGRTLRGQEPLPALPKGMSEDDFAPFSWRHATGDWGGFRSALEHRGVLAEAYLISDTSWVAAGGRRPGAVSLRALLDVTLTVDTERALGIEGGTWFADFMVQRGRDGSLDTGDLQVYSNIDSEDRTQVALLWYEQLLFGDRLRVKLGKIDANSDVGAFVQYGWAGASSRRSCSTPSRSRCS